MESRCTPRDLRLNFKATHVCSHVNKKALDQYTNFTEQREELARRQTENGRGEDKIKQLIQTLDMRKDEAIERTFKVFPAAPLAPLLAPTAAPSPPPNLLSPTLLNLRRPLTPAACPFPTTAAAAYLPPQPSKLQSSFSPFAAAAHPR